MSPAIQVSQKLSTFEATSRAAQGGGGPGGATNQQRMRIHSESIVSLPVSARSFGFASLPHRLVLALLVLFCAIVGVAAAAEPGALLTALKSPLILHGNEHTAYRDPLIFREGDTFYLFYSYVREEEDHLIYWYVAFSKSPDLVHWTAPKTVTPKGQDLNFASPGNVFRVGDEWLMGAQTYPIPNFRRGDKLRFNNDRARLWLFRSQDLEIWGNRELIKVKGPNLDEAAQGKMIDAFFLRDRDVPGKWWCFWKQDGSIHGSWSPDLKTWTVGVTNIARGENPQVFLDDNGNYVLIYAPANGIGMKRSRNLVHWRDEPTILLGQKDWPWCETRLTAGYVADFRKVSGVGKYLMVWHSMGPGKARSDANVNANCHIGVAWSDDLRNWSWPGKSPEKQSQVEEAVSPTPQLHTATTHPMKYYLSLPKNWSPDRKWPVLVAPSAHYGDKGKSLAMFAAERDARKASFIIVSPFVINADPVARMTEYRGAVADAIRKADEADGFRDEDARAKFDSEGIQAVLKDVQKLYHGEEKVYITGFSSSTHIAYLFLFTHPELLKGAIINSGVYLGRGVDEDHIPFLNSPERASIAIKFIIGEKDPGFQNCVENWQKTKTELLRCGHLDSKIQMEVIKQGNAEKLSTGHNWYPTRILDFCASVEQAP